MNKKSKINELGGFVYVKRASALLAGIITLDCIGVKTGLPDEIIYWM